MTKKETNPKVHVVLGLPRPVPALLSLAKAIEAAVASASKTFPSPTPTIAQLTADIASLDTAEAATLAKTKGSVQDCDAKLVILRSDLALLRAYVQQVADADVPNAATIAKAAGMSVRKATSHAKAPLAAKPSTTVSGLISVSAKLTVARQANDWEYSTDGGKTWIEAPSTLQAKTTIPGHDRGDRPSPPPAGDQGRDRDVERPISVLVH